MHFIGTALSGYILFVGAVFAFQRALLYPAGRDAPDPALAAVSGIQSVATETEDGLSLTHWYWPPKDPGAPVVVVFHGNAGHAVDRVPKLVDLYRAGLGLLIAGYRGYGGNPGRPSEEALTGDARGLLGWLQAQGVDPERTVLYGESLGTGIAVKMAAERPVGAVVLEAPYTSIAELAQLHYWYLPARWLVLDRWNSLARAIDIEVPLLVVHGSHDRTIPPRYGRRLFDAVSGPKEILVVEGGTHNDLFDFPEVPARVIDFLERHLDPAPIGGPPGGAPSLTKPR